MGVKDVKFHDSARIRTVKGVSVLTDAMKVTLGPKDRSVVIERSFSAPTITKDGVSVVKEIKLKDRSENMDTQMIRQVISKTTGIIGGDTTTTIMLTQATMQEGIKHVAADMSLVDPKRGIGKAMTVVLDELRNLSRPISTNRKITQVGFISANSDKAIGKVIAEAMEEVGEEDIVTVEGGRSFDSELNVAEGMQSNRGYVGPHFIDNPEKQATYLDDALILLRDKKISSIHDLLSILEVASKVNKLLLIVAEDVGSEILAILVVNAMRNILKVTAVRAPGFGDRHKAMLEDIAVLTGTAVISEGTNKRLQKATLEDLGRAKRVEVHKGDTIIVNDADNRVSIDTRIKFIHMQIGETANGYSREKLQERVAELADGVAVTKVGAVTEVEVKEKKGRIGDVLHAARAAVEEGIVPGGGIALLCTRSTVLDLRGADSGQDAGTRIAQHVLKVPLRAIVADTGGEPSIAVAKVAESKGNHGCNAATGKYGDLVEADVVDPTEAMRIALRDAASVVGLILATDATITEASREGKPA